jgi:hypothetical protein
MSTSIHDIIDKGQMSNCCGAAMYSEIGICAACKEHCEAVDAEEEDGTTDAVAEQLDTESDGSNKLEVDPRDGRIGYYIPTLEELMRACGEVTVEKKQDAPCEDNVVDTFTYEAFTADYSFVSDTPAEAVANLWLALNKKDK